MSLHKQQAGNFLRCQEAHTQFGEREKQAHNGNALYVTHAILQVRAR